MNSHLNIASTNQFSENTSNCCTFTNFRMRTVWSVHTLTHNYYDYNLIWKWWLALKVCQRVVEWRLHGWRCLWVKTPVNPVCTVANRGGWSETKQLLNSTNEGEYRRSLCKRIWDLSGKGVRERVEGRGGRVPIPISLHSISMQLFKIVYGGHTAKTALQRGC